MRVMAIVGAFGLDHLKLIDRPMPEPRRSEVVIRVAAVSLNYRDMDMVLGT
jgi:NADPH:quinone reductase-like Zn-dependent oxidoreductase